MPRIEVHNHWVRSASRRDSPNQSKDITPTVIVMHYTGAQSTIGALEHLTSKTSEVSAHFLIGQDGSLFQMVPLNKKAWHAGESSWRGRSSVGDFSIGIELTNPGPLTRKENGFYDLNGQRWPGSVIDARHKRADVPHVAWAAYSNIQLGMAMDLVASLARAYPIQEVIGHDDITLRKMDPGPAFPMRTFQALIPLPGAGGPNV